MTIQEVNEIFKSKYPTGEVFQKGSFGCGSASDNKVCVIFKDGEKVYNYSYKSYADLLQQLKFNVWYKHDIEAIKAQILNSEKMIIDGGYIDDFFSNGEFVEYSEEELNGAKFNIEYWNNKLKDAIVF